MTDHTPEPWPAEHHERCWLSPENYARARACVNACAGIPTERLQPGFVLLDNSAQADVQTLVETAEAIAERPIAGPDDGTKEDFMSELNSMIKKARAALAPFRKD